MKPSTLKCLRLLQRQEWVSITDFLSEGCGTRYGGRLHELREAGYVIEVHLPRDRSGCTYRLVAEPLAAPAVPDRPRLALVRPSGQQTWLWVATSDRGEWCGHWHTHMGRAARCARSQERYFRMRYGERQSWAISQVKVPLDAMVERRAA